MHWSCYVMNDMWYDVIKKVYRRLENCLNQDGGLFQHMLFSQNICDIGDSLHLFLFSWWIKCSGIFVSKLFYFYFALFHLYCNQNAVTKISHPFSVPQYLDQQKYFKAFIWSYIIIGKYLLAYSDGPP